MRLWAGSVGGGSREQEIHELALFSHEISIAWHSTDLVFDRLRAKAAALNTVASTCGTAGTSTENQAGLPDL